MLTTVGLLTLYLTESEKGEVSEHSPTCSSRVEVKQHTSWEILSSVIDIFHIPTQKISQESLLLSAVQTTREISHIILEAELVPDFNMTSIQISRS